jgi:hypothetical protein
MHNPKAASPKKQAGDAPLFRRAPFCGCRRLASHGIHYAKLLIKNWPKQPVSRVLFPQPVTRMRAMVIHLGAPLPAPSSNQPGSTDGPSLTLPYLVLLLVGFTWHPTSPSDPVSSYLTLSPLPAFHLRTKLRRTLSPEFWQAVFSLWHFPWGCPRWTLSSTTPYGARTFLPP